MADSNNTNMAGNLTGALDLKTGLESIQDLLSPSNARKLAKTFSTAFQNEMSTAMSKVDLMSDAQPKFKKSLKQMKDDAEKTFQSMGQALPDNIAKEVDKIGKASLKQYTNILEIKERINTEQMKENSNQKELAKMLGELSAAQAEYNTLQANAQDNILLLVDGERAVHEEMVKQNLQADLRNARSEEDKKNIQDKIDLQQQVLDNIDAESRARQQANAQRKANNEDEGKHLKDMANDYSKVMENVPKTFQEGCNQVTKAIQGIKSAIGTVQNGLQSFANIRGEGAIDNLNQTLSDRWNVRKEVGNSFNTGFGDEFDKFQHSIYETVSAGSMRGMYNEKELMTFLQTTTGYLFESKEAAIENSRLIAYGNKFLNMSDDSLKSLYTLEKMTNGDGYIRETMTTISKLQRSGLATNEAQLSELTKMSASLTEGLVGAGLSGQAAKDYQNSAVQAMAVLSESMGEKQAQSVVNGISEALADTDKGIAMFGENYTQALARANAGGENVVQDLLNMVMNNSLSGAVTSINGNGGLSVANNALNGSILGNNADTFRLLDGNWEDIQSGFSKVNASVGNISEDMQNVSETVEETFKISNEMAKKMADKNYDAMIDIAQNVDALISGLNWCNNLLNIFLPIIAAASSISGFKGFGSTGLGKGLAGIGKGMLTSSSAAGWGGMAPAAGFLGAGMIAGGGIWAGVDAFNAGTKGMVDQNGNQVMGPGWGTAGIGAIGGNKINTDSRDGKLTEKAKGDNTWGSALSGAGKGALVGAGIGTLVGGPVGTLIGGALGGLVGGAAGLWAGNKKNEEAEKLAEKQYKELQKQTEISKEQLEVSKRNNAALAYRYAIDTGGSMGGSLVSSAYGNVGGGFGTGGGQDFGIGAGKSDMGHKPWPITSGWPLRDNGKDSHKGVDFGIPRGTALGASHGGTISKIFNSASPEGYLGNKEGGGFGNHVVVTDSSGNRFTYAHLSSVNVNNGDRVSKGTLLGNSGNSGNSSGPHLHYQVDSSGGTNLDPYNFYNDGLWGATGPSSSNDDSSSSSSDKTETVKNNLSTGTLRSSGNLSYTLGGSLDDKISESKQSRTDNGPVISALEIINGTLTTMMERQDAQDRILDALTVKPIPNLGVN